MRAFPDSARVAVVNEARFEERFHHGHHGLVHKPVTHARLVYEALFRIMVRKRLVRPVDVPACEQILVEREDVVFQVPLEYYDILLSALPSAEFYPE